MNATEATRQLEEIADAGDDFAQQSSQLTAKWEVDPKGSEAVEPILRFMESRPHIDYGAPGPLVHFVENFPNYEAKLVESVERHPTPHTVWMLNRVINDSDDAQQREALLSVLKQVIQNPAADDLTRSSASEFLEFQKGE